MKKEILSSLNFREYFAHELNQPIPTKREVNVYCPFHGEIPGKSKSASLSINIETGMFHCFSCGAKGSVFDFYMQTHHCEFTEALQELATFAGIPIKKQESQANLTFSEKWERATSIPFPEAGKIYLRSRSIINKTIDALLKKNLMGWNPRAWAEPETFKPAIAFPMINGKNEIVGIQHIFIDGKPKKNVAKSKLSKGFFRFGSGEIEIITEAVIDAISAVQAFPEISAIATFSSSSLAKLKTLNFANPPILFFDNDSAGQAATKKTAKLLVEAKSVLWAKDHPKDINDLLKSDLSDVIKELINNAKTVELVAPAAATEIQNDLPLIQANEIQLRDLTKNAWAAILKANHQEPVLFKNSKGIVSLARTDDEFFKMQEVSVTRMRAYLSEFANWVEVRHSQNYGTFEISTIVPKVAAETILANPDPPLPHLRKVVPAPVFSKKGQLQARPGYSEESECFIDLNLSIKPIPMQPSPEDVKTSKIWIDELLWDFPLIGEAEKAHAIAFFLLPFIRDYIDGNTPLHLFEASASRTGKTLLVQALSYPYLGTKIAAQPEIQSNDELRKQITTSLADGSAYIFFDNLNYKIDSGILANVATARKWKDRMLGSNTSITLLADCIWVLTANNPKISAENLGRMVRIRQDAKMEFPGTRNPEKFRHKPLMKWIEEHRADLVWSALTLIQNWFAKGKPRAIGILPMGGFEEWRDVMGGIFQAAEIPGFLENAEEFRQDADDETATLRAFIGIWWKRFGSRETTTKELFPLVQEHDLELDISAKTEKGEKIKFGQLVKKIKDRRFTIATDGTQVELTITKGGTTGGTIRWKLSLPEGVCPQCGTPDFWKSKSDGKWRCLICEPPDQEDIAEWKSNE